MSETLTETCVCGGSGFASIVRNGVSGVVDCFCRRSAKAQRKAFRDGSGPWPIPEILRGQTFDTFKSRVPSMVEALGGATKYAGNPSGGILFTGPPGVGKSHLAAAILRQANRAAFFVETTLLLRRLRDSFNSAESESSILAELLEAPLVVLDDVGVERLTGYAEEKMFELIHGRYAACKPLICTTNRNVREGRGDLLADHIGPRSFDRLMGMCWQDSIGRLNVFEMQGPGRRWGA